MKICKIHFLCALFGLLAMSQAWAQAIVGAWSANDTTKEGAFVVVFLANGSYYHIENTKASEAPQLIPGFERGTYTWDPGTGAFTVTTLQDLNGEAGLSSVSTLSSLNIRISGDTATFTITATEVETLTRVTGASPIVGAWSFGNPAVANSSAVLVLFPNGVYLEAEDGVTGDPFGRDGIEHGTYAWNPTTGAFTSSRTPAPYVDTNGEWGLSDTGTQFTFRVSADGLTLDGTTGPNDSFSLARVGGTAGPTTTIEVVEFYNQALDHYFITWVSDEIAKLDNGTFKGWARTGLSFKGYSTTQTSTSSVCRIYIPPGQGDGHFFGRDTNECAGTMTKNPTFFLESSAFFFLYPPNLGTCGAGQIPVYRVFSNRADANHRYTTNRVERDLMVSKGWLAEGDGPDIVVMCAPA